MENLKISFNKHVLSDRFRSIVFFTSLILFLGFVVYVIIDETSGYHYVPIEEIALMMIYMGVFFYPMFLLGTWIVAKIIFYLASAALGKGPYAGKSLDVKSKSDGEH